MMSTMISVSRTIKVTNPEKVADLMEFVEKLQEIGVPGDARISIEEHVGDRPGTPNATTISVVW